MTQPLFDLSGRLALITGASRGLGLAMAQGLAEAGARVVLNGRDPGRLATAAAVLEKAGITAETAAFDVTDPAAVEAAITEIEARLGPLHVLVNNAGIISGGFAAEMPDAAWRWMMGTNIDAAFWVARAVGRRMVERGAGKVINIGSIVALAAPARASVAYTASKAALHGLTRALCAEWAGRGVQVNCIAPGLFETDMTQALRQNPEAAEARLRRTPAGRWGKPEDLAGTAVFLAAPASDFVNGQVIVVDGGILAVF